MASFDFNQAFCRNLGLVSHFEQQVLRNKTIAIAGLGGVGGAHLLTLTRMGIGRFHIADFDRFGIENFNRQEGACLSSLGQEKTEVMKNRALDINSALEIKVFPEGVNEANIGEFLEGVDLYIDGIDVFAPEARMMLFEHAYKKGIPAITAGPVGLGTVYQISMPGKMSFAEFYGLEGLKDEDKVLKFLCGVCPRPLSFSYFQDFSRLDFRQQRVSSSASGCQLSAGVAGIETLKILLKRGRVYALPHYHQFDAYLNKHIKGWMPWGHKNPLMKLRYALAKYAFGRFSKRMESFSDQHEDTLWDKILLAARWAPSGDNTQPWSFKIISPTESVLSISDPKNSIFNSFYNHNALHAGILLESMRLAATRHHCRLSWELEDKGETDLTFHLSIEEDATIEADPLSYYLEARMVNRRSYRLLRLTDEQKEQLKKSVEGVFQVVWHDNWIDTFKQARLSFKIAKIRFLSKECYENIKDLIAVDKDFVKVGIPQGATGLNAFSALMLKRSLRSWQATQQGNRYLKAHIAAAFELSFLPGIRCGAWFTLIHPKQKIKDLTVEEGVENGQAIQRFWLTAEALGLALQPDHAPSIFCQQFTADKFFSQNESLLKRMPAAVKAIKAIYGIDYESIVFRGRIGVPRTRKISSRSCRRDVNELREVAPVYLPSTIYK